MLFGVKQEPLFISKLSTSMFITKMSGKKVIRSKYNLFSITDLNINQMGSFTTSSEKAWPPKKNLNEKIENIIENWMFVF